MMPVRTIFGFGVPVAIVVLVASSGRADAPSGRYTFPSPGTVFDNKTKLTWQQVMSGGSSLTQAQAISYCSALSLNGAGWRLPTIKELLTIVDYSRTGGPTAMIDPMAFPNAPTTYEWSITPYAGLSGHGWVVIFVNGLANTNDGSAGEAARCVR